MRKTIIAILLVPLILYAMFLISVAVGPRFLVQLLFLPSVWFSKMYPEFSADTATNRFGSFEDVIGAFAVAGFVFWVFVAYVILGLLVLFKRYRVKQRTQT